MSGEGFGHPAASAFTDAECDAVRDWVGDGGSLLLIADHAPFGSAAESLARRFGVAMSKGVAGDPANSEGNETFLVFSQQNHLLGDHPITQGRDDSERLKNVQTFTGTSFKGPEGSVPILKLADTAIENEPGGGDRVPARGRSQGLALTFGRGRVVVMGEAAELSAQVVGLDDRFGMNVPGIDNRQLALNILHWLSGLLEPRGPRSRKPGDDHHGGKELASTARARKPCQFTPSLRIRARSVCGLIFNRAAAPAGPSIRPPQRARACSMCRAIATSRDATAVVGPGVAPGG